MNFIKYPSAASVDAALHSREPLLLLISFDGKTALLSHIDEAVEHHILLDKASGAGLIQGDSRDIDKYFRVVVDHEGADWTFVCPPDYKNIPDKVRRISAFYRDGFSAISDALQQLGLLVGIDIPRRYRRHLNMLTDDSSTIGT